MCVRRGERAADVDGARTCGHGSTGMGYMDDRGSSNGATMPSAVAAEAKRRRQGHQPSIFQPPALERPNSNCQPPDSEPSPHSPNRELAAQNAERTTRNAKPRTQTCKSIIKRHPLPTSIRLTQGETMTTAACVPTARCGSAIGMWLRRFGGQTPSCQVRDPLRYVYPHGATRRVEMRGSNTAHPRRLPQRPHRGLRPPRAHGVAHPAPIKGEGLSTESGPNTGLGRAKT